MKKRQRSFRIGQLAQELNVQRFVVRFWEKEFDITSHRSSGGQRFYTQKEASRFATIKELLYDKGYTIAGAKKILDEQPSPQTTKIQASQRIASLDELSVPQPDIRDYEIMTLTRQIMQLQKKLIKLRELL